jgi:cell division septation protein DedD
LGLRYRVIVNTTSDRDHARIRRIVPDAFRTRINGRLVMQVGAFATQDKVDEMLSLLKKNGFTGTVLPID